MIKAVCNNWGGKLCSGTVNALGRYLIRGTKAIYGYHCGFSLIFVTALKMRILLEIALFKMMSCIDKTNLNLFMAGSKCGQLGLFNGQVSGGERIFSRITYTGPRQPRRGRFFSPPYFTVLPEGFCLPADEEVVGPVFLCNKVDSILARAVFVLPNHTGPPIIGVVLFAHYFDEIFF